MMKKSHEASSTPMKEFLAYADIQQRSMERDIDRISASHAATSREDYGTATTSRPERQRRYESSGTSIRERGSAKLKKSVAMAALAGASLLAANQLIESDKSSVAHNEKIEQTALSEVKNGWYSVAVLHEGATYRTAPKTVNTSPQEGPDTVASTVGEGKLVRIDKPLVYVEDLPSGDTNTWLGFSMDEENRADTSTIYWANLSELQNQETEEQNLISLYDYQEANPNQEFNPRYDASIELGQPITGMVGMKSEEVARAHVIDATEFQRDVEQQGLVQNR